LTGSSGVPESQSVAHCVGTARLLGGRLEFASETTATATRNLASARRRLLSTTRSPEPPRTSGPTRSSRRSPTSWLRASVPTCPSIGHAANLPKQRSGGESSGSFANTDTSAPLASAPGMGTASTMRSTWSSNRPASCTHAGQKTWRSEP